MGAKIHPTAMVSPKAEIADTVEIGPHVIIEDDVKIGANTVVMANSIILGDTVIGERNMIHYHAIIGNYPQHIHYKIGTKSGVRIGDDNVIRENATIHRAHLQDAYTVIGNRNFMMANAHVAHDCIFGNNIVLTNGAFIAGHVTVESDVTISSPIGIHQFLRIGRLAMIGGLTRIVKDVPPFLLVQGDSEVHSLNVVGLKRAGVSKDARNELKWAFKLLYRSGLPRNEALKQMLADKTCAEVKYFATFIEKSARGICASRSKSRSDEDFFNG